MVRDTTCKDKAGGVAKDDGGLDRLYLYVKGFESWLSEHSKKL
jgi:hypothetical protein